MTKLNAVQSQKEIPQTPSFAPEAFEGTDQGERPTVGNLEPQMREANYKLGGIARKKTTTPQKETHKVPTVQLPVVEAVRVRQAELKGLLSALNVNAGVAEDFKQNVSNDLDQHLVTAKKLRNPELVKGTIDLINLAHEKNAYEGVNRNLIRN